MKKLGIILLFIALGLIITQCASSKKCDGRKGQATPMGKI